MSRDDEFVARLLKRVRQLVARENGWIQNQYTALIPGAESAPYAADNYAFCLSGAHVAALDELTYEINQSGANKYLIRRHSWNVIAQQVWKVAGYDNPVMFNDTLGRSQKEIVAVMDKAVAAAREKVKADA